LSPQTAHAKACFEASDDELVDAMGEADEVDGPILKAGGGGGPKGTRCFANDTGLKRNEE